MGRRGGRRAKRWRFGGWIVVLLGATVLTRAAFLRGLVTPIRIAGGSMAETFLGDHFGIECADCRFVFRCDQDDAPANGRVVCPNCGARANTLDDIRPLRGDRVLVDRWPAFVHGPRRWDVVALRTPGESDHLSVKRVIGLPGEQVAIRDGDIYINGELLRKPPARQREFAVLVHDDTHRPATANLPARWQPQQADSGWRAADDGYICESPARDDVARFDWLTYRNWRCFANPLPRSDESSILDSDGYNQNESRELHEVADLRLGCRVTIDANSHCVLVCNNGWETVEVALAQSPFESTLKIQGQIVAHQTLLNFAGRDVPCDFAVCDQQVSLLWNGKSLFDHKFQRSGGLFQPTSRPFAIGGRGRITVSGLKVFRDIHFLEPQGLSRDWSLAAPLAADEVFVLGDNPPISVDSRQWNPRLKTNAIVGRVIHF